MATPNLTRRADLIPPERTPERPWWDRRRAPLSREELDQYDRYMRPASKQSASYGRWRAW